jgi:hypothetical protein
VLSTVPITAPSFVETPGIFPSGLKTRQVVTEWAVPLPICDAKRGQSMENVIKTTLELKIGFSDIITTMQCHS